MSRFAKFLKELASDVYWGEGNPDNPTCPNCGAKMSFHGGDREYGDGYWDCPGCDYTVTEEDISDIDVY